MEAVGELIEPGVSSRLGSAAEKHEPNGTNVSTVKCLLYLNAVLNKWCHTFGSHCKNRAEGKCVALFSESLGCWPKAARVRVHQPWHMFACGLNTAFNRYPIHCEPWVRSHNAPFWFFFPHSKHRPALYVDHVFHRRFTDDGWRGSVHLLPHQQVILTSLWLMHQLCFVPKLTGGKLKATSLLK